MLVCKTVRFGRSFSEYQRQDWCIMGNEVYSAETDLVLLMGISKRMCLE